MMLIIIGAIIGVAIAIYQTYQDWDFDFVIYLLNSILGFMIGAFLGFWISISLPMSTYNKHYSVNIETLQDNSSVSGQFFLGCGQIDGDMKYVLYFEEKGLYQMMQIKYNLVQIKYSKRTPRLNVTEIYLTDSWINYFAIDFDIHDKTYIIEVPKGTIRNNYNLDAQ
jgi:uncharacterized protein YneF (UPF0154 family)